MESGRQTQRKGSLQSNSLQSSIDSKNKQFNLEKQTNLSSSMQCNEKSSQEKSQNLRMKKKGDQIGSENMRYELEASDFSVQEQKQNTKLVNTNHDYNMKLSQENRERKSPISDESANLSGEAKKQLEMLFEIAQSLASKGDIQQAIHIYNKIVKLNEKSTSAWIAIGHCYAVLGDNYKALSSYQKALSITSDSQRDDQLWYGIGLLYQKTGDWKNAETSFKNALKLNPKSSLKGDILYNLGIILKEQGDIKGAIRVLMNSITAGSFSVNKMVDVLCAVGLAQEELDELTEAMKIYKHALALDENNLKALQCAGWLSFQLDRTNEALEYLTKANLISEDDPNIWFMQARCFLKHKQSHKAYEKLSNCIKKDQINSMYWNSLGILFGEMQQLKSAHECFSNALKFGISIAENYFNMGCLYELCSQFGDAIIMYDKAIELQPNFQLAYTRKLGAHFAQAENKQDALSDVKFKHHKFTLAFDKDQKNKNLLNISQQNQSKNGSIPEPQTLNNQLLSNNEKNQSYLQRLLFNQGLSEPIFSNALQPKGSSLDLNTHLIKGYLGLNEDYNLESLYNIKENSHTTQAEDLIGNIKISNKSKVKGAKSSSKENVLKDNIIAELQSLQNSLGEYDKLDKSDLLNLNKTQTKNCFELSNISKEEEEDLQPRKKVRPNQSNSPNNPSFETNIQEASKKASNVVVP